MEPALIITTLNSIAPLEQGAIAAFLDLCEEISIPRNEYLVRQGERTPYAYFLEEGLVRVFFNNEGNEYNKTFTVRFPGPGGQQTNSLFLSGLQGAL